MPPAYMMILSTCKTAKEAQKKYDAIRESIDSPSRLRMIVSGTWKVKNSLDLCFAGYPGLSVVATKNKYLTVISDNEEIEVYPFDDESVIYIFFD